MMARSGFKRLGLGAALVLGAPLAFGAPISLPEGGLVIDFNNREQIDPLVGSGTDIADPGGGTTGENTWGIVEINTIRVADPTTVDQSPPFLPQSGVDSVFDAGNFADGQITGIFHSLGPTTAPSGFDLASNGGFIDLYWDEDGLGGAGTLAQIGSATPGDRTAIDEFTNFTDGTFLVRLAFASGIQDDDGDVHLRGTAGSSGFPLPGGEQGQAEGFLEVADMNGDGVIDSLDGFWAAMLDSDFFERTVEGDTVLRDVHFRNVFTRETAWDPSEAPDAADDVFGADSSDPASVVAVPEPATTALLGLALLAMGATLRDRRRS